MTRGRRVGVGVLLALAATFVAGIVWLVATARSPTAASLVEGEQQSEWTTGYRVVPDLVAGSPVSRMEARMQAFAKTAELARAELEIPQVAFGTEALRAEIELALARVVDRADVSIHVRDLESSRILFDYSGDTLLNPASNNKLITGSAALDLLGADYVFATTVLQVGDALVLVGEGDPTLDLEGLTTLAHAVADQVEVGAVARIVVDDTAFSERMFGPGYDPDRTDEGYMAPSGALSLAFNSVEVSVFRVGSRTEVSISPPSGHIIVENRSRPGRGVLGVRTLLDPLGTRIVIEGKLAAPTKLRKRIHDPGLFTGGAFAIALADASQSAPVPVEVGVAPYLDEAIDLSDAELESTPRMLGRTSEGVDVVVVAERLSPPLFEIVAGMLAWSNNFVAEQILRTLGWRMSEQPGDWTNGSEVVRDWWQALGADPDQVIYENGSGLSRRGRVTTRALVDLLAIANRTQPRGAGLIDALPVAGREGTVSGRLRRSGKRVRAKTGTLDGVSGLTGVITSESGDARIAFSIIINVRESGRMVADSRRALEDRIVMAVLRHIDDWEAGRDGE